MQKPGEGFWVVLPQMIRLRTIHARTGQFVWVRSNHQNQFVLTITWSASPPAQTAPQASDSADKQELLLLQGISCLPERAWRVAVTGVVRGVKSRVVGQHKIWQTLEIWRRTMGIEMNYATLSLLCLLAWSLPFALSFPSVERCKGLAEISQRSETPSVPHCGQAFASRPYTLWYFDVPWGALWFLLSLAGWVPGHQVSVPSGRVRRARQSAGSPRRRANEWAGLSTEGIGGKWSQSWLCVHREAGFGGNKVLDSAES